MTQTSLFTVISVPKGGEDIREFLETKVTSISRSEYEPAKMCFKLKDVDSHDRLINDVLSRWILDYVSHAYGQVATPKATYVAHVRFIADFDDHIKAGDEFVIFPISNSGYETGYIFNFVPVTPVIQ